MQQIREFHTFGSKSFDIQSIISVARLSPESYRLTTTSAEVIEIDGKERCEQLLQVIESRLGITFSE